MDHYIADKKIKTVEETDRRTPLGVPILKVTFEDGTISEMSHKRFLVISSEEISDPSKMREVLVNKVASDIYALLQEYDIRLGEVSPITSQLIAFAMNGEEKASCLLWNVGYTDELSLLKINDVLLKNVKTDDYNGSGSAGSVADKKDPE